MSTEPKCPNRDGGHLWTDHSVVNHKVATQKCETCGEKRDTFPVSG
jgi:hypothetical protein